MYPTLHPLPTLLPGRRKKITIFLPKQLQLDKFRPRLFVRLLLCLRSTYELVIRAAIPLPLNRLEERIYDYVWGKRLRETNPTWLTERETERRVFILDGLSYSFNLGGSAVGASPTAAPVTLRPPSSSSSSSIPSPRPLLHPPQLSHATEPQPYARTHAHTAQPFSLTEPLAYWAQLVPEPTLGLHIWCQRSVRGRPSVWMEGGGGGQGKGRWRESKEIGGRGRKKMNKQEKGGGGLVTDSAMFQTRAHVRKNKCTCFCGTRCMH